MSYSYFPNPAPSGPMTSPNPEVEQLKAQVAALEQLIEVYEQETLEQSRQLEQTLNTLQYHTQELSYAETTLTTLRTLLNSLGDAVIVINQVGNFLLVNDVARSLLDLPQNCPSLRHWARTWPLYRSNQIDRYPLEDFPLSRALNGENPAPEEIFVQTSDFASIDPASPDSVSPEAASGYWFRVTARALGHAGTLNPRLPSSPFPSSPLPPPHFPGSGSQGLPPALPRDSGGGIVVFHNITSLKTTELALRESEARSQLQAQNLQDALDHLQKIQGQLIQTEKMSGLGQLVAGVAHEINNPVNFIHGNLVHAQDYAQDLLQVVDMVLERPIDHYPGLQDHIDACELDFLREDFPKVLASMRVGTERIREIVKSLRNFSRLDQSETKAVDLHEGLESTLLLLQHRLKGKPNQPEILLHRRYGPLPSVECYPAQLNQVFMNLLVNAIDAIEAKATPADREPGSPLGHLTITTQVLDRDPGAWVEVSIADDGIGMSPETQQKVFNPFFTTKPTGQGTGMGMSISYQIVVDRHGGDLTCQSAVNQGTTFRIRLPLHREKGT
ncbi:MAG: sensor histidine kinase [Prochlorothrix sp.]